MKHQLCATISSGSGSTFNVSAFIFDFHKIFSIWHLFRADVFQIPCLRKYSTSLHIKKSLHRSYSYHGGF